MFESRRRILASVAALSAAVVLSGCEPTQDGDPSPPPPSQKFRALFNPSIGYLPWPHDLLFGASKDFTLDIPAALMVVNTALGPELNTLDGFGTSSYINTTMEQEIDGASLSGSTVVMVEMYLSNITKLPAGAGELPPGVTSPVSRVLKFGEDYVAEVSDDVDSAGKILRITPLKPLRPSTGATNIGYYVYLTSGIKDTEGRPAAADSLYALLKAAPSDCKGVDAAVLPLCLWTKAHLSIASLIKLDPASVVLSWNFTTQSVEDTFDAIAALVPAQPIGVAPTGFKTSDVSSALQGKADIYVGTTQFPYYLKAASSPGDADAVLKSYWKAAGPSPVPGIDPESRNLTRFNPVPGKTTDVTVPLLVTVPNATANGGAGCPKPAAGWPVAIVQHGLGGNRSQTLAMADSFADACFIVAAIDLPLHGITDPSNPLYAGPIERTFNVDLVNNTTVAPGPDGKIDPSGVHFVNLKSPLTSRDNLRQGEADLIVFHESLGNLDVTGDGQPDVDPVRIHYVGLSLGGIVGGAHVHHSGTRTATLAVPGGVVSRLLFDSDYFGPIYKAGIAAGGQIINSTIVNNLLFRDFQTIVDPGDPINHIATANAKQPVHLIQVDGDAVVPNSATQRLVTAGDMRQISTPGPNPVGATEGVWVRFTQGYHGSLFDPSASLAATVEMQRQTIGFAASAVLPGGPFVVISDPSVIGD